MQVNDHTHEGVFGPISPEEQQRLRRCRSFREKAAVAGFIWEPDWPMKDRFLRVMDVLRPPMAAMKLVATLADTRRIHPAKVVALEIGHSIGAQALSLWLPHDVVSVKSRAFGPDNPVRVHEQGSADVVVVGVPSLWNLTYVAKLLDVTSRLGLHELDELHQHVRRQDPHAHVGQLVDDAMSLVKPGGILIVVGSVEDGEHHYAVSLVEKQGNYEHRLVRYKKKRRDTVEQPVLIPYQPEQELWCPFKVPPPEDRLVSAWRKFQ